MAEKATSGIMKLLNIDNLLKKPVSYSDNPTFEQGRQKQFTDNGFIKTLMDSTDKDHKNSVDTFNKLNDIVDENANTEMQDIYNTFKKSTTSPYTLPLLRTFNQQGADTTNFKGLSGRYNSYMWDSTVKDKEMDPRSRFYPAQVVIKSMLNGNYPELYDGQPTPPTTLHHEIAHDIPYSYNKNINNELDTLRTISKKLGGDWSDTVTKEYGNEPMTDILGWGLNHVPNLTQGQQDSVLQNKYLPNQQSLLVSKQGNKDDLKEEAKLRAIKIGLMYLKHDNVRTTEEYSPQLIKSLLPEK